jgi:hypothetical protein
MSVVGEFFIELHVIIKCILIYVPFHCALKEPFLFSRREVQMEKIKNIMMVIFLKCEILKTL